MPIVIVTSARCQGCGQSGTGIRFPRADGSERFDGFPVEIDVDDLRDSLEGGCEACQGQIQVEIEPALEL